MADSQSTEAGAMHIPPKAPTVSYEAVSSLCSDIVNLSDAIGRASLDLLSEYAETKYLPLQAQLNLIHSTAEKIGLLADHCQDYESYGSVEQHLDLPDMKYSEGDQ